MAFKAANGAMLGGHFIGEPVDSVVTMNVLLLTKGVASVSFSYSASQGLTKCGRPTDTTTSTRAAAREMAL